MFSARLVMSMVVAVVATGVVGMAMFNEPLTIKAAIAGFVVAVTYEVLRGKI